MAVTQFFLLGHIRILQGGILTLGCVLAVPGLEILFGILSSACRFTTENGGFTTLLGNDVESCRLFL